MIKYQWILTAILKNPRISNSKLHPYNILVKSFCKTENGESNRCLTNRPNLFVYYYDDDYYNIAPFRINLVERWKAGYLGFFIQDTILQVFKAILSNL